MTLFFYYQIIYNGKSQKVKKIDLDDEEQRTQFVFGLIKPYKENIVLSIKPPTGEPTTFIPDFSLKIFNENGTFYFFQSGTKLLKIDISDEKTPYIFEFSEASNLITVLCTLSKNMCLFR